ncbi:phytoene desaturase family protein [Herpetosiphon giganteus]|uniref:phytoene desaturase family protein n=1 Tax=Herpetosiphon giganteus TaxID=2029754 RepID=UPI003B837521
MTNMAQFDAIVVGGGHNGLTCACYLQKAGIKTLVIERRPIVGGAVCTETMFGGYKMDVGSSAHIMIHLTPVVRELELHKFGLEYIDMDPFAWYPLPDGSGAIEFWRDLDKTCASIEKISPKDAHAYRQFVALWGPLNEGVFDVFLKSPSPANLGRQMLTGQFKGEKGTHPLDILRRLFTSYGHLINETFESEAMRAAMGWLAAQSGPPPHEIGTGDFAGWHSMLHESGAKHPRGGSGMLTQAMAARFKSDGGTLLLDAPVERIIVQHGVVQGVELTSGEIYSAPMVISNAHVQTTLLKLVEREQLPNGLAERVGRIRVGNGFGMAVRCAADELPDYLAAPSGGRPHPSHHGLQLLCPSIDYLNRAVSDYDRGVPATDPAVIAMTFSAIDPDVAPKGKHTLFLWGQYHPYELSNGEDWDSIADREADKLLEVVYRYAPNMRGKISNRYVQTPLTLERTFGMLRGNVMHVEMSFDQMFAFRPLPELSEYRVAGIKGLYLTGASTHPGGGVFAASGYNTAQTVLKDRQPSRQWVGWTLGAAAALGAIAWAKKK